MKPVTIEFRGQTVTVTDISIMEDRSVGINWHVEDFRLRRDDGSFVPDSDIENMTDAELDVLNTAVWNAQESGVDFPPDPPGDDEDGYVDSVEPYLPDDVPRRRLP